MAHGIKPYGRTQAIDTIFAVQDMGELAARLNSINTFSRSGQEIWHDDFESGIEKWFIGGAGLLSAVVWTSEHARNGGFSALLTGGSTSPWTATLGRYMPYPVLSRFGFEFSVSIRQAMTYFTFGFALFDGVNANSFEIRFDPTANTWERRTGMAAWVQFLIFDMPVGYGTLFDTVKLFVDGTTMQYVGMMINDAYFPMLGQLPWTLLSGLGPYIHLWFGVTSRPGNNDQAAVDDVIITQNEP